MNSLTEVMPFSLYALHAFRSSPILYRYRFMKHDIVPVIWTFVVFCAILFMA